MSNLADNIRAFMHREGLKEQAAARVLGVDQSTLNRIINPVSSKPNRNPSAATVGKIAAGIGVTVDTLLNGSIERPMVRESHAQYQSQPLGLNEQTLAVSLVAIEKAMRERGLDPEYGWGHLAGLVIWACELQGEKFPDGVKSAGERFAFDVLVQKELEERWGGFGSTQRHAGQGAQGREQTQATRAQAGRGGRSGRN